MKMSKHSIEDRMDRLMVIATYIGWGEIITQKVCEYADGTSARLCLTDTGITLVKRVHEEFLVTAYITRPDQMKNFYPHGSPERIFNKVMKNQKYRKMCG